MDASGDAYVAGWTTSNDFPTTSGAYEKTFSGSSCAFVTKFAPTGSSLIYSTYLCGSGDVQGISIALDTAYNAYVVGGTTSTNFPVTPGAFRTANAGGLDAFVAKLNSTGSSLIYSTYLGGSGDDYSYSFSNGIAVDSAGNAYVVGITYSTNFPTTSGAFDRTCGSDGLCNAGSGQPPQPDNFVTKLNAAGSALVYSTYLGGSGEEEEYNAIAIDSSGNAYVTGGTLSTDFPTTVGAFQTSGKGLFVTKLNAAGSALVYSTLITSSIDTGAEGEGIAVDTYGNAYVTGYLNSSSDFPTTPGAFKTLNPGGNSTFVTKLNATGSALVYSTFLGGSGADEGWGVAVDSSGDAYVSGTTSSSDFPTVSPVQATCGAGGNYDAFVTELNAAGSALIFSTCLGGTASNEDGYANALDPSGNVYVVGDTSSLNFPTTPGAFKTSYGGGGSDAFVAKITTSAAPAPRVSLNTNTLTFSSQVVDTMSAAQMVTLTNTGNAALTISQMVPSGDFALASAETTCSTTVPVAAGANCTIAVTFTPTTTGTRKGAITITDNAATSPQSIGLSGTGATAGGGSSTVTTNPATLYFASQPLSVTSPAQSFTLTNSGSSPLAISNIAYSGDFAPATSGTTCSTSTPVAANGGTCTINVTFTPTALAERSGAVTLTDNAQGISGSTQQVTLSGNGMQGFPQSEDKSGFDSDAQCVIDQNGCALMSTASMLTTFNGNANPTALDYTLTHNTGYCSGCMLNWTEVPFYMPSATPIHLVEIPEVLNGIVQTNPTQTLNDYLTKQVVQNQNRVILGLSYQQLIQGGESGSHYIFVTASTGDGDWQIFDPNSAIFGVHTLNQLLVAGGFVYYSPHLQADVTIQFSATGVETYASGASGGLSFQACSPIELLVIDPQGRQLGNTGSGSDILQIPFASYGRNFPMADNTGGGVTVGDPAGIKTAYIPSPIEGTYMVTATGTGSGAYTLNVRGVATDNTAQVTTATGTASPGSSSPYQVGYTPTPGTPVAVTALPGVTLSAAGLTFGSQTMGTGSTAQAVTIMDTGGAALAFSNIAIQGDFAQTNTCGTGLSPKASCAISVTFTPTAGGTRNGTLTITDNAPGSPHTVALSGTGQDFTIAAASGSSTSATTAPGSPATYTLSVGGEGGMTGTVSFTCAGAPSEGTCTVSPNPATAGSTPANVTVSVTTTAPSVGAPRSRPLPPVPPLLPGWKGLLMLAMALAALAWAILRGNRPGARRWRAAWVPLGAGLLLTLALGGCGGGGGGGGGGGAPSNPGTPAGTYSLTVTGTAGSGSSALSHSVKLTLTVT